MPAGRILVIAPDADLRESIAFALATYGYTVAGAAGIDGLGEAAQYDCTVLDEAARPSGEADLSAFCDRFRPVLLLAYSKAAQDTPFVAAVIEKPLRGEAVLQAVRIAIAGGSP